MSLTRENKMSGKLQPLPEYQSLIRWSVQDVVNWLSKNGMSDCMKSFRSGFVDGNKLVNVTTTDLTRISCPKRHIQDIMKLVSQVIKPGMQVKRGAGGWNKTAPSFPPNEHNFRENYPSRGRGTTDCYEGSPSGSEDEFGWDADEFDDEESFSSDESYESPVETNHPVAPPRPSRGLPAMPQPSAVPQRQPSPQPFIPPDTEEFYEDPDNPPSRPEPTPPLPRRPPVPLPTVETEDGEDYEDPDKAVHVQNFHCGPLPTPPTESHSKPVPIGQRKLPPSPNTGPSLPSRQGAPALPGRSGGGHSVPDRSGRRVPPTQQTPDSDLEEEDYEEPDNTPKRPVPPPLSSVPSIKQRAPAVIPDDQEAYEEPDIKPRPPPISSVPSFKHKNPPPPQPEESEEEYEEPDAPVQQPPRPKPGQRKLPPQPGELIQKPKASVPPSRRGEPEVQEQVYETVDEVETVAKQTKQPPHPKLPLPAVPQPESVQELYEVPENNEDSSEDYLEMDDSTVSQPTKAAPVMPPRRGALPPRPSERQPVPTRKAAPVVDEQETYEIPDDESSSKRPGITNGSSLHGHRSDRELPPIPSVQVNHPPPARETVEIPKEFTEADLLRQKWYHGDISRHAGDELLKKYHHDGMYFIRKSSQGGDKPYTLQIYFENKTYNLPIRQKTNGEFAMGKDEKANEKTFVSLLKLVSVFKKIPIILAGGKQTTLVKSMPKS